MKAHNQISDLLPLYVSGALERDERLAVEKHLAGCAECRADLALWQSISAEVVTRDQAIPAPRGLADAALASAHRSPGKARRPSTSVAGVRSPGRAAWLLRTPILRRLGVAIQLVRAQAPLVQREIWPASALVIALGTIAALIAERAGFVYALAPLIAAACVSLIYGPENDPAYELALSTPTSPRQILLARLVLVFGYNLTLVIVATLGLLPALPNPQLLLGDLALNWLAPMTFLSAAALALSVWVGATNAISITYVAWLGRLFAGPMLSPQSGVRLSPALAAAAADTIAAYQGFWQSPALLLALSALLFATAVWLAGRQEREMLYPA